MRPNTYCKGCRKPTGMKICIQCKLKSVVFLYQEFDYIMNTPDMISFVAEMRSWYLYDDSI